MRIILVAIVFALLVPGLLFGTIFLRHIASEEAARSQTIARSAALRTAEALDRELSNLTAAMVALSTSPALASADYAAFHRQATALAAALQHEVVLCDLAGEQLANTRRPFGAKLPNMGELEAVQRAIDTKMPAVTGLYAGATNQEPAISVMVPEVRDGRTRTVLGMSLSPASLSALLQTQGLPAGWFSFVVDGSDRIFARSSDLDRFLGTKVSDDFRAHAATDQGLWTGRRPDGTPVLTATQRVRLADWRVGVGVPLSLIEAPVRHNVVLLATAGCLTLGLACLLAWRLASFVTKPLQHLARSADALAQGLPPSDVHSSIAEVDAVSRALAQATNDLRARAAALAAERAQLAAVIETVPVGLIIAEAPNGIVVAGNSSVERLLRHPVRRGAAAADMFEWVTLQPDGARLQPDDYPLFRVLQGAARADVEGFYQPVASPAVWIRMIAAPIRAPDGQITGGVVAILDIDEAVRAREAKARSADELERLVAERTTALQAANQRLRDEMLARATAESQLRQSQKMEAVGQLTGGIAHDFNNLLTIVVGSLDLLRRRVTDDKSHRLLDNAMTGANRAATLTARLLAFSRQQPLIPQTIDVNGLVAGMADLLYRTLGAGVQIETALSDNLWPALADPNQLENALLNLAVNARDAIVTTGQQHGRLTIGTANTVLDDQFVALHPDVCPGDYVLLSVADTGSGMAPEVAARVFEPFYTTKPPGQGTGLGLSQVHGFVKQSGGHVDIETSIGEGTTILIYVPRAQVG